MVCKIPEVIGLTCAVKTDILIWVNKGFTDLKVASFWLGQFLDLTSFVSSSLKWGKDKYLEG